MREHGQELNIIVCIDPRRCGHVPDDTGRNGPELLKGLQQTLVENGWADIVQVTPCRCIFGCTYGPRLDAVSRTDGTKVLYGSTEGKATISRRGTVEFRRIPSDLTQLVSDNLQVHGTNANLVEPPVNSQHDALGNRQRRSGFPPAR